MKRSLKKWIARIWDHFEEAEPDISTERLIQQTVDHFQTRGFDLDASDICEAVAEINEWEKVKP